MRRRATRPATFPEDRLDERLQASAEWTKSARARGTYRPEKRPMEQPTTDQLIADVLVDMRKLADQYEESRGPEPIDRSKSNVVHWDTAMSTMRHAVRMIESRLGDDHRPCSHSKTCSPPPNHWTSCMCGWRPGKAHGDESRRLTYEHIEQRTGVPYVPKPVVQR